MENHPIPQDVTGFKFKLIGSVTVRQFLYLLLCGFFAWVMFSLPIFFLIKFPFFLFFVFLGIGLAFVPIEGRPMDKMLLNFLKAIPAENQYVYHKVGAASFFAQFDAPVAPKTAPSSNTVNYEQAKKAYLMNQLQAAPSTPTLDKKELDVLTSVKSFFEDSTFKTTHPSPVGTTQHAQKTVAFHADDKKKPTTPLPVDTHMEKAVVTPITPTTTTTDTPTPAQPTAAELHNKLAEMQGELMKAMQEKESLQKKFFEMTQHKSNEEIFKPQVTQEAVSPEKKETPNAKTIAPGSIVSAGFPSLPDIPNILLGIIKDPRGKVLANILVEVMDKNDIPVRAFKTNKLGQFISATPLPDGTYHVQFEDPQKNNEFDKIEVSVNGTIFQPLEVTSIDQRERLRRELFGEDK